MPYKTGLWVPQAKERNKKRFSKSIGKIGELEALKILGVNEKLDRYSGADIKWNNKLVEVKTSMPNRKYGYWKFLLYKQKNKVDYFLTICKDIIGKTKYVFLIPDKKLPRNNLIITNSNLIKYKKFLLEVR